MTAVGQFAALDPLDRRLVVRALRTMTEVRLRLAIQTFPDVYAWATPPVENRTPRPAPARAERVGWAVSAVGRRVQGSTCLMEALAAARILGLAGLTSEVRIGVDPSQPIERFAHAWVESQGVVVVGADQRDRYSALPSFGEA